MMIPIRDEPQPCGWSVLRDPWEVLPNDDIGEHTSGLDCRCRPTVNDEDAIIHNAFDGREDIETGRRRCH
jgi:hypothetical protein